MPPIIAASTDIKSLAKVVKDGSFNESAMTVRVLVEKLDLDVGKYMKEKDCKKRKRLIFTESSDDSDYEVKSSLSEEVNAINKKVPRTKGPKEYYPPRKSTRTNSTVNYEEVGMFQRAVIKAKLEIDDVKNTRKNIEAKSIKNQRMRQISSEDSEDSENEVVGMSAYEKMVEQKKLERMAFLQSLKINEVKSSLSEVVNALKKKKVPRTARPKEYYPPRKSKRTILTVNYEEAGMFRRVFKEQEIKGTLSFEDALKSKKLYTNFREDVRRHVLEPEEKPMLCDNSVLQKLPLKLSNVAQVTRQKISSLAWYPSADNMILAAGSKFGNIGISNVNSGSNPHLFKVCNEWISHLQFNPFNPVEMFSSSFEGTLRCGDMVQSMFTEVYSTSKTCSYFDFIASTTYLVGLGSGEVALVDRASKNSVINHFCHEDPVKTVNIHPVNKNVFVTAGSRGSVRIWDLRMLQKQPIVDVTHHEKSVSSAFFSSVTGHSLLTKSLDHLIRIFNCTNLTQDIKLTESLRYCNGRHARGKSRAEWLPNSDDIFLFDDPWESPGRTHLYNKNLKIFHPLMHENKTTRCNAFHPFVPSIAGASYSGGRRNRRREVLIFT